MIICNLRGGFGNHLFQISFAKGLAVASESPLWVSMKDLPDFWKDNNCSPQNRLSEIFPDLKFIDRKIIHLHRKLRPFLPQKFRLECRPIELPDHSFIFSPCNRLTVTDGYFQRKKFIEGFQMSSLDWIKSSLERFIGDHLYDSELRNTTNSVGVHVRRGDYLDENNRRLQVVSEDYYFQAMEIVIGSIRDPTFYFFSDDLDWCKWKFSSCHFKTQFPNPPKGIDPVLSDFSQLSMCQHQIIPNSTFSWWAAFLNTYSTAIKIAPDRWTADNSIDIENFLTNGIQRISEF